MSKIVETIHHGSYRNTRVLHTHPATESGLAKWVKDSPYLAPGADHRLVAGKLHEIATSGRRGTLDIGWVHWEVS